MADRSPRLARARLISALLACVLGAAAPHTGAAPLISSTPKPKPGYFPAAAQLKWATAPRLDSYRVDKTDLFCTLPSGELARIAIVDDSDDFLFLAVKTPYGPGILANERKIPPHHVRYVAFAFYLECAAHAIQTVKATGPDNAVPLERAALRAAACLAIVPTERAPVGGSGYGMGQISLELREEYGDRDAPSAHDLERCRSPEYGLNVYQSYVRR
jgi:hypothetical protein